MKNTIFRGAATALVTPLTEKGIDFESLAKLIEFQIAGGISALVITGTTGESSTLTDEEHKAAIAFAVKQSAGRVPVIAGTGSNDTDYAIALSKFACEAGVDGLLLVTPYYNKATQNGLIAHFTAIADAVTKPIILYNVPSRTGCNLKPETMAKLAEHPRIVGIKEASGDLSQIATLAALCGDKIDIYSGNDDQILPVLSLGGAGVISVLSNLLPGETDAICQKFFAGDNEGAKELQLRYLNLVHLLFCEVNPIPAKAAMSAMGYGENYLRLPLTPMEKENEAKLLAEMKKHNLLV
ncbi:MAG: 4-hydroxy-tetrahydrodipicolinate synthase [Clostridia bacterium]|nr:4-hydroxy-tetrahydrodipicolinate synthase [Clostridia bacterium]